jgi:hypothetical protein
MALRSVLKHGIVIIQKPRQVLLLPPFWIYTTFCTETCTAASYVIATALKYADHLSHTDLFLVLTRLWSSKEKEQTELCKHAASLAEHLQQVLNDTFSHSKPAPVIQELCKKWDTRAPDRTGLRPHTSPRTTQC